MKTADIKKFIDTITTTLRQAGYLSIKFQGKVDNLGKSGEELPNDTPEMTAKRSTKTLIDESIQEMILLAAASCLDSKNIHIAAEEDTPSLRLFSKDHKDITLVIDPLDGTAEYLAGNEKYSLCVGLIENGVMLTALVYFPKIDVLYFLDEFKKPYTVKKFFEKGLAHAEMLKSSAGTGSKKIYGNSRVPHHVVEKLVKCGYQVVSDAKDHVVWPEGILGCLNNTYICSLFHTPQVRDILLGAIISHVEGGYALDFSGKKLNWEYGGRLAGAVFGTQKIPEEILGALR